MDESLIPPIGSVSQAERMFRVNWVSALLRSPGGVPLHRTDFVSRQGRAVRIVDVREPDELTGPLGYVPGSDWVARAHAVEVLSRLPRDTPIVIVSRGGERAGEIALQLENRGMRLVSALMGGIVAWRDAGFMVSRDPSVLQREGRVRASVPPPPSDSGHLSREDVLRHVGDVRAVRWMKLAALLINGRASCVDGRDDSGVIGTPGGDGGEMVLGLAAVERVLERPLDCATVDQLLTRRTDTFGRFYVHTDIDTGNTLIKSMRADRRLDAALANVRETMQWRAFLTTPPAALREVLLEHALKPEHIGCGHVKRLLSDSDAYGVRSGLVSDMLRSFFLQRWSGVPELELAPLPGGHAEGAVLNIHIPRGVYPFSTIPMISPSVGGRQAFINHPDVMCFLREQLARWLTLQDDLLPLPKGANEAISAEMERLAELGTGRTLGALAKGLPIYAVDFRESGIDVRAVGSVS